MITLEDYFGRITYTPELEEQRTQVEENAKELIRRVNLLLPEVAHIEAVKELKVNSGWRPAAYNATIPNAAPRSKHITGQAIDLADPEGELDDYLINHRPLLLNAGLWMEHPSATKGWCHLQSVPPRSGNLVFYP